MSSPRFLIGIDLGTTNSAVAYVDLQQEAAGPPRLRLFEVPQVVAPGEVGARETLPSFLYFPETRQGGGQATSPPDGAVGAGGAPGPTGGSVAGVFAREQGALVPTRQVSSAKSWLSHPAVDRTARILPWGAEEPFVSPVDASAAILRHLREAWNRTFAKEDHDEWRMERQAVVLAVPASFDQEARELTLQAATDAGLEHLTLLEEPLAAFYAWIASHRRALARRLGDGEQVLVCDVGGGTSDFTVIRVRVRDDEVSFERTAVGEHLLLGGDNVDLALARRLEQKLGDRALTLVQRLALRRSASAAKERLLSDPTTERVPIAVLGSGRAIVGGAAATELTRDEVFDTLTNGFLPLVEADARPVRDRRTALRELGLPYAGDPAITKHLAAFLAEAAAAQRELLVAPAERVDLLRPDAVLFNGGFFAPAVARERILENLRHWFERDEGWQPKVLENRAPAAAVALGAAYFGLVRQGGGLRVRAGSARGYYVGVGTAGDTAVCILPRGTEEGTAFELAGQEFAVMTNRPVSFPLFSSAVRHDAVGAIVRLADGPMHAHAPLATVLRYGKKSRQVELAVGLAATYTETGTLQVSCASHTTDHRWRLQFQLRGEREIAGDQVEGESESVVPPDRLAAAREAIADVFGAESRDDLPEPPSARTDEAGRPGRVPARTMRPEGLPSHLESTLGFGRHAWPLPVIRALADTLLRCAAGRKRGPGFEARWLNLLGFCLRPGFGAPLDDWRVGQARGLYVEGPAFPSDLQCQAEWIVFWQRLAGGLKAGQQRELYQRYATMLEVRSGKRTKRANPQIQREAWRLLASLEQLSAAERVRLGEVLLGRLEKDQANTSYLWAIGRFGARMPAHGPVTSVVPADRAEAWIARLLSFKTLIAETAGAIAQIGGRSDDPLRDIGEEARRHAIARLAEAGFAQEADALHEFQPPAARDALQLFGESLPVGLRLKG